MDFNENEDSYLPTQDIMEEYTVSDAVSPTSPCGEEEDEELREESLNVGEKDEDITPVSESLQNDPSRRGHHPMCLFSGLQAEAYCADLRGNLLAVGGGDDCAYVFDCDHLQLIRKFEGFEDSVIECKFVAENILFIIAMNGKMRLCRIDHEGMGAEFDGPEEVMWIQVTKDHRLVYVLGSDGSLWVLSFSLDELAINCLSVESSSHAHAVTVGCLSEDEKFLLSGDQSGLVILWSIVDRRPTMKSKFQFHPSVKSEEGNEDKNDRELTALAFHPTSPQIFAIGSISGDFAVLMNGTSIQYQNKLESSIEAMNFSKNFPTLIVSDMSGTLLSLDSHSFHERWRLKLEEGVTQMIFPSQIKRSEITTSTSALLVSLANGAILKVDIRTGTVMTRWMGSADGPTPTLSLRVTGGINDDIDHHHCYIVAAFEDGNVQVYQYE